MSATGHYVMTVQWFDAAGILQIRTQPGPFTLTAGEGAQTQLYANVLADINTKWPGADPKKLAVLHWSVNFDVVSA